MTKENTTFRGYYSVLVEGNNVVHMRTDFASALAMMLHLWMGANGEKSASIEYTDDRLHYVVTMQPADPALLRRG